MIFLDTNICIAAIRGHAGIAARLLQHGGRLRLPFAVVAELRFGVEKSRALGQPFEGARRRLEEFLLRVPDVAPLTDAALTVYARIRAELETAGRPIGNNDLWIAAQALSEDALLVSNNLREFKRVPGLRLENWLR
jgi:tRNA(fMet)-specific endonuclease VapC